MGTWSVTSSGEGTWSPLGALRCDPESSKKFPCGVLQGWDRPSPSQGRQVVRMVSPWWLGTAQEEPGQEALGVSP